jgi:tight adherence protein C
MPEFDNILALAQQALNSVSIDSQAMILGVVFASVFLAIVGSAEIFGSRKVVERRLQTGQNGPLPDAAGEDTKKKSWALAIFERLSDRMTPKGEHYTTLHKKMMQAGYLNRKAGQLYFTARILLAVLLPSLFLLLGPILSRELTLQQVLLFSFLMSMMGFFIPTYWVARRTNRRQMLFREAFPDALDMLLVSVEAGLSLDAAIDRVGKEIGNAYPLLGEQFKLTGLELRAGKTRHEALRNFADRVGIDEVSSLVTLLVQSDALGTSIAQTLRIHAEEIRLKRMLAAEEKAHKLPVKLSVPLVTLILPALMIVILSPGVINIIRILMPVLNNTDFGVLSGNG